MLVAVLLLIVGLVVLYFGAEYLVEGASRIALSLGLSPMVIGLTIVALATSAPEFVVSLLATLGDSPDLAIGNVVGSNVANIALIVGAASVIFPMAVDRPVLVRDYPLMMVAIVIAWAAAAAGERLSRGDGLALLAILGAFLSLCLQLAVRQNRHFRQTGQMPAFESLKREIPKHVARVCGGIIGLVVGARLMVDSAVEIARAFDISELVIGVSIVAIGTSLPELATSVVAALRKQPDISLGNIIGSNIFNTCFILGGVATIRPIAIAPEALRFDLPAMAFICLLLFPLMRLHYRVTRVDGAVLLTAYVAYLVGSYLSATGRLVF